MANTPTRITGVKEVQKFLTDQIAGEDLKESTGKLRAGTKAIAEELIIPELKAAGAKSGVPIGARIADTARAKADRVVVVKIGAVNPKLSGFKRGRDSKYRTGMAWGSEQGGKRYGVARIDGGGYWVRPLLTGGDLFEKVRERYNALLADILREYGR